MSEDNKKLGRRPTLRVSDNKKVTEIDPSTKGTQKVLKHISAETLEKRRQQDLTEKEPDTFESRISNSTLKMLINDQDERDIRVLNIFAYSLEDDQFESMLHEGLANYPFWNRATDTDRTTFTKFYMEYMINSLVIKSYNEILELIIEGKDSDTMKWTLEKINEFKIRQEKLESQIEDFIKKNMSGFRQGDDELIAVANIHETIIQGTKDFTWGTIALKFDENGDYL